MGAYFTTVTFQGTDRYGYLKDTATMKDAYESQVAIERREYGTDPYRGTVKMSNGFTDSGEQVIVTLDRHGFIEDEDDLAEHFNQNVFDKGGPAVGMSLVLDGGELIGYAFHGVAPR